jgi:hypothetical protein
VHMQILGDRSMKHLYLNPNTLLVVSGPPAGSPIAAGSPGESTM